MNLFELTEKRDSRGTTLVAQRAVFGKDGKLASAQSVSDIMYEGRMDFMYQIMDEVQLKKPVHVQRDEAYALDLEIEEWNRKREEKALAESVAVTPIEES